MNTFFIRFHLLSPMQIGAGSLGMIEKTLLCIPGRVIWGAFTNTLTLSLFPAPRPDDYVQVGSGLDSRRISTFFPEIDGDRMLPVIPDRKWICPGKAAGISFSAMNAALMTSAAATAIAPDWMAAARGTLHASDLISPVRTDKNGRVPVVFSGYMEIPNSICGQSMDSDAVRKVFDSARIGGGRKRGWGRISADTVEPVSGYDGYQQVAVPGGRLLTADMPFSPSLRVSGEIRLLSRREYDPDNGSGQRFSASELVWSAGSMIYDSF